MTNIQVSSKQAKQVIDITDQVQSELSHSEIKNGVVQLFITHTTAALTTADLDPGMDLDMIDAFEALMPKLKYRHPHRPEHAVDHILAAMIGPSVNIPCQDGRLVLGSWQRVVLVELKGPTQRQVILSIVPSNYLCAQSVKTVNF